MKFIKSITLILSFAVLASCLGGCGKNDNQSGGGQEVYKYTYAISTSVSNEQKLISDEWAKLIKEKFNIEIEYDKIPLSNWYQKLNLLFASGEEPEIISGGKENQYKPWAVKGYLKDIDPEKSEMKNYISLFDDKGWAAVRKMVSSPDGNMYFLPSVRQGKAGSSWLYRKDIFDKAGVSFPKTADELYTALKAIKGKFPDKVLISSTGNGNIYALGNFYQMFWMPDLLFQENSFVDPDTKEYIPYAFSTQRCRDMIIFLSKLYKEDLIDKEILSLSAERFNQKITTGSVVMSYNDAAGVIPRYQEMSKTTDPGSNWTYSKDMMTAYPDRGYIFKKFPLYFDAGICFSKGIVNEKLERILKFFDWCASSEGRSYATFGFEGLTYKKVNGKIVPDSDIYDITYNSKGTRYLSQYGIPSIFFNKPHDDYLSRDENKTKTMKAVEDYYFSQPKYFGFDQFPMNYSEQDDKERVDMETAVSEVRDQMLTAFLMGVKDPKSDTEWGQYIATLNKVGLQKLCEIKTRTYKAGLK